MSFTSEPNQLMAKDIEPQLLNKEKQKILACTQLLRIRTSVYIKSLGRFVPHTGR